MMSGISNLQVMFASKRKAWTTSGLEGIEPRRTTEQKTSMTSSKLHEFIIYVQLSP